MSRYYMEDSNKAMAGVIGETIAQASLSTDVLVLRLESGKRFTLADEGQSCCENRYMTCDDDLATFAGAQVVSIEQLEGPQGDGGNDCHDTEFVHLRTTKGTIVCQTHNEHNGYYGGFLIKATLN
jgi:hypothetical protein